MDAPEEKRRSVLRELPVLLLVAFLIAFVVKTFVAQAFYIPSESMDATAQGRRPGRGVRSPTGCTIRAGATSSCSTSPFENGQAITRPCRCRVLHGILESVGLRQPSTEDFIKRVIGLPGETVEGEAGTSTSTAGSWSSPTSRGHDPRRLRPMKVPKGKLWVMGDNRSQLPDSRVFGPIDEDTVVGRAIVRVWPIPRIGFL